MASEPLSDFVARLPQERRAEANYLRKRLKSLGDRVGPNDMRLSEALWQASEIVRGALKEQTDGE